LRDDHDNARFLAGKLAELPGIQLDPKRVETNIVIFDISATGLRVADLSACLKTRGVLMNGANSRQMRAVTHFDVTHEDCDCAVETIAEVLASQIGTRSHVAQQRT
jgi:threonine aldolase